MNHRKKLIFTLVLSLILVMFGISYAFFSAIVSGDDNASLTVIKMANLGTITFNDGPDVLVNDLLPGTCVTKTFSLTSDPTADLSARFYIDLNVYQNELAEYGKEYGYLKLSTKLISSNDNVGIFAMDITDYELDFYNATIPILTGTIGPGGVTQTYQLTFCFDNLSINQNVQQGKIFRAKLTARADDKEVALINYIDDNTSIQDLDYKENTSSVFNPERGFAPLNSIYMPGGNNADDFSSFKEDYEYEIKKVRRLGYSIDIINMYLSNYKDTSLSPGAINALNDIFNIHRENGLKLIIRFSYTKEANDDATSFDLILEHVDSIKDIINNNKDIIMLFQAGFIGRWGEMHGSQWATTDYINQLLNKLLNVLDKSIYIAVRKPSMLQNYENIYGENDRLEVFNDGMLGSITDLGTFEEDEREETLDYISNKSINHYYGGEVMSRYDDYTIMEKAHPYLTKTSIDYLNPYYDTVVYDMWDNSIVTSIINETFAGESYYNYVYNHLGYRLYLTESKIDKTISQGDNLNIQLKIKNVGFSSVVKKRNTYIIFKSEHYYYKALCNIDITTIKPGEEVTFDVVLEIPTKIEASNYELFIQFEDTNSSLKNISDYYIKFANYNIWNENTFANRIGILTINEKNNSNEIVTFTQVNIRERAYFSLARALPIENLFIIDGLKDNTYHESDNYYSNNGINAYATIWLDYLYIYTDSGNSDYIDLFIEINGIRYQFQNDNYCNYNIPYNYGKNTGYEFKIAIADLNIDSLYDITSIRMVLMDKSWDDLYDYKFVPYYVPTVDGIKDSMYTDDDLYYSENGITAYAKIWLDHLYVYTDSDTTSNVDLFVEVNGIRYQFQNDEYCSHEITYEYGISDTGHEFKIPMSSINITSLYDISYIRLILMDKSWEEIYDYTFIPYIVPIIDGINNEYDNSMLVYTQDGYKVYYHELAGYGYVYVEGDITPYPYSQVKYGMSGSPNKYGILFTSQKYDGEWLYTGTSYTDVFAPYDHSIEIENPNSGSEGVIGDGLEFKVDLSLLSNCTLSTLDMVKVELNGEGYYDPVVVFEFKRK